MLSPVSWVGSWIGLPGKVGPRWEVGAVAEGQLLCSLGDFGQMESVSRARSGRVCLKDRTVCTGDSKVPGRHLKIK